MSAAMLAELKRLMKYDPLTGKFTRIVSYSSRARAGDIAGHVMPSGYRHIRIHGVHYYAHRLAWLYVHGHWPPCEVDHIDRDRDNNRLMNLREATRTQNLQNRGANLSNPIGTKGVRWHKRDQVWQAQIGHNGKYHHLGTFPTIAQASAAYKAAADELFTHHTS